MIQLKIIPTLALFLFILSHTHAQETQVKDGFEGDGTINTWYGDGCGIDTDFENPYQMALNTSETVLMYSDEGGEYANIGFDIPFHFDLEIEPKFSLLIYIEGSSLTGSQNNQVSLKLQNGAINEPWSTQTEIIKNIEIDKWQEVVFDFKNDNFINLNENSPDPVDRDDLNRLVLQVNGENNTDKVTAYFDDVEYKSTIGWDTDPNDQGFKYLIWNDEFEGDGALNSEKWFHQTQLPNGDSWFNGELQHYTNREDNSFQKDGYLNVIAKKENFTDQGVTKNYTSARLNSKFAFTYGRVEVRAKLPKGPGTWPALWFLGKNIDEVGGYFTEEFGTVGWPACGEIDLMEHWGTNQNFVQSAMHTPSSSGNTVNKGGIYANSVSDLFHIYGMVWTTEKIDFTVDGKVMYTYNPEAKNDDTWPFYKEQYMLINTAITADISGGFTESPFVIDYVRIYSDEEPTSTIEPNEKIDLSLFPNPVQNQLNVSYGNVNSNYTIKIIDYLGREVLHTTTALKHTSLDISSLEKGVYQVQIIDGNKSSTTTFVK